MENVENILKFEYLNATLFIFHIYANIDNNDRQIREKVFLGQFNLY